MIQLSYSSGNITNVAVEDFPAPFPNPLIVTTDWTYLAQQANYSDTNTHTLASYDRICQFRNITDSTTLVLMNLQLVFQPKYVYNHLSNYTLSTSTIYDTQTGVLDYTIWTQTNHFDNGTVSSFGYKLINMAYNGSTDAPTPSVFLTNKTSSGQIPLYTPVFLLIPIAMVRKRLKTQ